jgi:homocitrate synthase NifV
VHEAGIHADGILKCASNYEIFSPESVGLERKISIGKHSGRHIVKAVLQRQGIEVDEEASGVILEEVRASSIALKRSLTDKELVYLYNDWKEEQDRKK